MAVNARDSDCSLHQIDVQIKLLKRNVQVMPYVTYLNIWLVLSHYLVWIRKVVNILQQDIHLVRVPIGSCD